MFDCKFNIVLLLFMYIQVMTVKHSTQ